jgi:hypothetical protein
VRPPSEDLDGDGDGEFGKFWSTNSERLNTVYYLGTYEYLCFSHGRAGNCRFFLKPQDVSSKSALPNVSHLVLEADTPYMPVTWDELSRQAAGINQVAWLGIDRFPQTIRCPTAIQTSEDEVLVPSKLETRKSRRSTVYVWNCKPAKLNSNDHQTSSNTINSPAWPRSSPPKSAEKHEPTTDQGQSRSSVDVADTVT